MNAQRPTLSPVDTKPAGVVSPQRPFNGGYPSIPGSTYVPPGYNTVASRTAPLPQTPHRSSNGGNPSIPGTTYVPAGTGSAAGIHEQLGQAASAPLRNFQPPIARKPGLKPALSTNDGALSNTSLAVLILVPLTVIGIWNS